MDLVRSMWTEAAEQDHCQSMCSLASLYAEGMGVEVDLAKVRGVWAGRGGRKV